MNTGREILFNKVRQSHSTKRETYKNINPTLRSPSIYKGKFIPEYLRIAFIRFRLSSHRLRIETGRWSRIPRELRLCVCGDDIQNEEHVLLKCPMTNDIRKLYNISHTSIVSFFSDINIDNSAKASLIYKTLKIFEKSGLNCRIRPVV